MVDFEKIGRRIREERKLKKRVSQERMALDLGYYQADISNLEKAKSGSGITDLYKLDLIADYLEIPLEALIFGMEVDKMVHYYGSKIQMKEEDHPILSKNMKAMLDGFSGHEGAWEDTSVFDWGPYKIYHIPEYQIADIGGEYGNRDGRYNVKHFMLKKGHCYITLEDEVLGVMVFSKTDTTAFVYTPAWEATKFLFPEDVIDISDLLRILNPYWALYKFSSKAEKAQYQLPYLKRMDAIHDLNHMPVIIIESVYIKEDCRRHGLFRLFLDLIHDLIPQDSIYWLNLEPTSGSEMSEEAGFLPAYTPSDLGQISMNASIAEKMGFTIDTKIEKRQVETEDEEGNKKLSIADVRRAAYIFPEEIKKLIAYDNNLVAQGRAKEELQKNEPAEGYDMVGLDTGKIGEYIVAAQQEIGAGMDKGKIRWIYAAITEDYEHTRFGVTPYNIFEKGLDHDGQIFSSEYLDDAEKTEYYEELEFLYNFAMTTIAGIKESEAESSNGDSKI